MDSPVTPRNLENVLSTTMAQFDRTQDFNALLNLSRELQSIPGEFYEQQGYIKKRIAILTGYTFRPIRMLLGGNLLPWRIYPAFFESAFGVFEHLIYAQDAELKQFQPDLVFFCTGSDHLDLQEGPERWLKLWRATNEFLGCDIVHTTFEEPHHRLYGHYEFKVSTSETAIIQGLNRDLAAAAPPYVHFYDVNYLSALFGRRNWRDDKLYDLAKLPVSYDLMPVYAKGLSSVIAAIFGRSKKCVVLDLDNTLWEGVVGDVNWNGIVVGKGSGAGESFTRFQKYLKGLKERGVLLAVCSKNDPHLAREPFEKKSDMELRLGDFACFVANWEHKTENICRIAQELEIGLNAMVFVDDNPVERELVRQRLPEVAVLELPLDPAEYTRALSESGYFESIHVTQEDRNRGEQYRAQAERKQLQDRIGDYDEFLHNLEMKALIEPFDVANLPRITQIINKTNQFNLVNKRYTQTQIQEVMRNAGAITRYVCLQDRFGDNGLIAALIALVRENVCVIDTWVMSCRVLKRTVENLLFQDLVEEAIRRQLNGIKGFYVATEKNGIVRELYHSLAFTRVEHIAEGDSVWYYDLCNDDAKQRVLSQASPIKRLQRELSMETCTASETCTSRH